MRKILFLLFVFLFFAAFQTKLKAQQSENKYINASYLYNGVEYLGHPPKIQGSPFFLDTEYNSGNIVYNGIFYDRLNLKYDVVTDQLVTRYIDGSSEMSFLSGFVSKFSIQGFKFVYLPTNTFGDVKTSPGYFQELVDGKASFFIKRKKNLKETPGVRDITSEFVTADEFFILKDGNLHRVSSKSSVLNVFKDKKKELNAFLKDQSINFRDNPELATSKMVQEYNELTN